MAARGEQEKDASLPFLINRAQEPFVPISKRTNAIVFQRKGKLENSSDPNEALTTLEFLTYSTSMHYRFRKQLSSASQVWHYTHCNPTHIILSQYTARPFSYSVGSHKHSTTNRD